MKKRSVISIKSALDRYAVSKNPLKRVLGMHDSMTVSPAMAAKYVNHSDPAVAKAAKKLAKLG